MSEKCWKWECGAEVVPDEWGYLPLYCPQCRRESDHQHAIEERTYAEVEVKQTCPLCGARCTCATFPGHKRAVLPNHRWRGWRDRQPQRNPVTIRHVGDPPG